MSLSSRIALALVIGAFCHSPSAYGQSSFDSADFSTETDTLSVQSEALVTTSIENPLYISCILAADGALATCNTYANSAKSADELICEGIRLTAAEHEIETKLRECRSLAYEQWMARRGKCTSEHEERSKSCRETFQRIF